MTTKQLAGDTLAPAAAARRARSRTAIPTPVAVAVEPPATPAAVIRTVLIASCGWPGPDAGPQSRRTPARRR